MAVDFDVECGGELDGDGVAGLGGGGCAGAGFEDGLVEDGDGGVVGERDGADGFASGDGGGVVPTGVVDDPPDADDGDGEFEEGDGEVAEAVGGGGCGFGGHWRSYLGVGLREEGRLTDFGGGDEFLGRGWNSRRCRQR